MRWTLAPPPAARILLDGPQRTIRIGAAAADRRLHVRISLLGSTAVTLTRRGGNPATATLRFPTPRDLLAHTFVVTVVARTSGARALSIERTLIVDVLAQTVALSGPGPLSRWSYVVEAVAARATPSPHGRVVAPVPTTTSDEMPNLVRVLAETRRAGKLWVEVALTALPNGRRGWIPRDALSVYHAVTTRLVIDTRRLTLTLFRGGRRVFRAPVGVGTTRWPTPRGTFYIRERLTNFHDAFYGPVAFGTSARSETLTDWPGGGIVGIHGTNSPQLVPGRISHGCIRLRNADVLQLARLLPLGTPVEIR